jgi:hypothetical protein
MILYAKTIPCRHPGVVRMRAGRDGRDDRQGCWEFDASGEIGPFQRQRPGCDMSSVPAFAEMTVEGGRAAVAQGDNA